MPLPFYMKRDEDCPKFLSDKDEPLSASELQPVDDPINDVRHNLAVAQHALQRAAESAQEAISNAGCSRDGLNILMDVIRFQANAKGQLEDMELNIAEAQRRTE